MGELDRAGKGGVGQRARIGLGEAQFLRRLFEAFEKIEYVRGSAAGNAGHRVEHVLVDHPQHGSHGFEDTLGELASACARFRRREGSADAFSYQCRRVGHCAHEPRIAAEPAGYVREAHAGRDRQDNRHVRHVTRDQLRGFAHLLRLDGEHRDVGAVDRARGSLPKYSDSRKLPDQLVLLRGKRFDHRWPYCPRR